MACDSTVIEQLVIGDDYLGSNGRSIVVEFCPITGFDVGVATCQLGFVRNSESLVVDGVLIESGDMWQAQIDITASESATLSPGRYDWSCEVKQGGKEITVAKSINYATQVQWVEKQV